MNKEVVITIVGKEGKENARLASREREKEQNCFYIMQSLTHMERCL
jgi:hypothetical protein